MQKVLKDCIKIVGRYPDGVELNELQKELVKQGVLELGLEKLQRCLEKGEGKIEMKRENNQIMVVGTEEIQNYYQKQYIFEQFFTENSTREILQKIYKIILKSKEKGISYMIIREKFNNREKKEKLELTMVSHYCRRLYEMNLIKIISQVNFKNVIARIFIKKERGIDIQNNRKINKKLNKVVEMELIDDIEKMEQERWQ